MTTRVLLSTVGQDFDHHIVWPAEGTRGGILIAWKEVVGHATETRVDNYSASVCFTQDDGSTWWLTGVYGPQHDDHKILFM